MSGVLVFLQQEQGKLNSGSLAAISAAKDLVSKSGLQSEICGLCLGTNANQAANHASKFGLNAIYVSEQDCFANYVGLVYADAVSNFAKDKNFEYVIAASSSSVKDFLPAVCAKLDAAMASDILSVVGNATFTRPMYAGNVIAEVVLESKIKVVSVRATAFAAAAASDSSSKIESFQYNGAADFGQVVSFDSSATGRPELGDAKIVVSGGRGVQSKEGFEKFINPLADALGAAIGASRAAVDAGFAPNDWQVGQTGKTVAPQLYIAIGISGAIQHLAGMKDSKVVVAINKDPEAPIFEIADYGLVADLEKAVPELISLVKS